MADLIVSSETATSETVQSWICCQIGAREHYAIPRALLQQDTPVHLFTDVWAAENSRWLLPGNWRQRHHHEIPDSCVTSWNLRSLLFSSASRMRGDSHWSQILRRNDWFDRAVASRLDKVLGTFARPPVVFSYSYAALNVFRVARSHNCTTILGQIDPARVEVELVQQIERQHGWEQSEWPPSTYWDRWRRECELSDQIVVNSEWSRSALIEQGVAAEKLKVIPLAFEKPARPIERTAIPDQFSNERPLRVLFLGQAILRKGIAELIEAANTLEHAPVEWRIVGGGPAALLDRLKATPNVVVVGQISRDEVSQEYQAADVFILPTHSDGFALTQLEAAAYDLPIIASKRCGNVVEDRQNGLLLEEVTGAEICDGVAQLLAAPEFLGLLRANQSQRKSMGISTLGSRLTGLVDRLDEGGTSPCST